MPTYRDSSIARISWKFQKVALARKFKPPAPRITRNIIGLKKDRRYNATMYIYVLVIGLHVYFDIQTLYEEKEYKRKKIKSIDRSFDISTKFLVDMPDVLFQISMRCYYINYK